MNRKVIAVVAVLLVAAAVVLPAGYFGQVAETTMKNRMANMPYGFQMELVDYQRGWFSSTARLEWQPLGGLPMPGMLPQGPLTGGSAIDFPPALEILGSEPIRIDLEIAHGPVYFAVGPGVGLFHARGRVDLGDGTSSAEPDAPDSYMDLYVSSFSGGTVNNRLEVPNLEWGLGPLTLNLAGALVEGEWTGPGSFQLQRVVLEEMDMNIGLAGAGVSVSMSDVDSRTEYPQGLESGAILAASESTSTFGEVLVESSEGNTVIRMTGLSSVDVTSREENGTYRADSDATIESLEFMEREFAPIEIQQVSGGLGEAALLQLLAALNGGVFETPAPPQMPENDTQAPSMTPPAGPAIVQMPQLTPEMKEAVLAMFADSPYTEISAVLTYMGEHTIELRLRQAIDGERVAATADMMNLLGMLSVLDYAVDFEIPIAAAEDLFGQGIVQMGLMQGLLQQTETAYSLSVALQDGILTINGRPMPIPMMGPPPASLVRSRRFLRASRYVNQVLVPSVEGETSLLRWRAILWLRECG